MDASADKPHILVVDDDTRLRELLKSFLSRNGFRVSTAKSAAEARQHLEALDFDLIVLDVMMPGQSGLEFAGELRRDDDVPILMLTAMGDSKDRIAGLEKGVDDYLGKRKWLAAFGYGLAALTKPVFPLATGIGALTAARFVDRATGQPLATEQGDVLIGADGIHSAVRAFYYPSQGRPRYSGEMQWRASVEAAPFLDGRTQVIIVVGMVSILVNGATFGAFVDRGSVLGAVITIIEQPIGQIDRGGAVLALNDGDVVLFVVGISHFSLLKRRL